MRGIWRGSYIPSCEEDETDDDMDVDELVSENEEYTQDRNKLKEKKKCLGRADKEG